MLAEDPVATSNQKCDSPNKFDNYICDAVKGLARDS